MTLGAMMEQLLLSCRALSSLTLCRFYPGAFGPKSKSNVKRTIV